MTNSKYSFPSLVGWEDTRDTLSHYAKVAGAVPRAIAEAHPKWWHISLSVQPDGLRTKDIPLPSNQNLWLLMNLRSHWLEIHHGPERRELIFLDGLSSSSLGDHVVLALGELGVALTLDQSKFADDSERAYELEYVERYLSAITRIDRTLKNHKSGLVGDTGPVQLWPHHFDLAFEWFGTKMVSYKEEAKVVEYPSQINFGFSPGDESHPEPYFYSNPWPFDENLTEVLLPSGALWFTESWQGSLLPYSVIADQEAGEKLLLDYYQSIFTAASPLLTTS